MSLAGAKPNGKLLAVWREAGEWWEGSPPREIHRVLSPTGKITESIYDLPSLVPGVNQAPLIEDHTDDVRPEKKIRDEKAAAACGAFSPQYYEQVAAERTVPSAQTRQVGTRPNWRKQSARLESSASQSYVPLHAQSGYAFGRSTMLAEEIAHFAAQAGCPAAAIADPFSLMGAVEFSRACLRHGVRPIIGAAFDLESGGEIVLIARSKRGYANLSQLITECQMDEPRGFPMATWERLHRWKEDLICLTGGDSGPLNRCLIARKYDEADALMQRFYAIYQHNIAVEIERCYLPWHREVNHRLRELATHHGLLAVAGGRITHARPEHFPAQDVLVCANTLCLVEEVIGRKPPRADIQPPGTHLPRRDLNAERYFRTGAEMQELYADAPELLENTHILAERIDDDVLPARTRLPSLYPDDNHALREIVEMRAHAAYPKYDGRRRRRIEKEVERICRLGYASHFLVANDFCDWALDRGIQFSGRGSVVDSAVAYVLGFSRIDAIQHNLHFDRFLPDDGTKRPDIDIDFEARHRDGIRNYLIARYGADHVGQVCAIGAFCTRGIVREVGKALGIPNETLGFLAKRIHSKVPPDQIMDALDRKPELRGSSIPRERFQWVFRLAERLMDVPRDVRCHSSGVVISDQPLSHTVPVMWSASDCEVENQPENMRLIQWDKRSAKYYFDKFDILCLRGQDVLSGTQRRMRQVQPGFDVRQVPIDDPETYRTFRSGELIGIPQSASPAMRQAHIRIKTENLEDASLVQAGIRPGVGGAVKMNELIARRRGKPYSFSHPLLEEILGNTYGIIVFQEQVDQLLQGFCGYSSGQAEDIRDAIHKRRREDFGKQIREQLIDRVLKMGHSNAVAEQIFELVAGFKGYGFAQGHALAFAEISVRSVYCQQNFPAEYFAALLSAQPAGYYGPCTLVNEARNRGVLILPPDVNTSDREFTVEDVISPEDPKWTIPNGGVRVALSQVRDLSRPTLQRILDVPREPVGRFDSIFDFCKRVRPARNELEALILCGAFDALHPNRRALLWAVPKALSYGSTADDPNPCLPFGAEDMVVDASVEDFSVAERSVWERRILHLDVSQHLMGFERERIAHKGGITTQAARTLPHGEKAFVVGNPIRLRFPPTPSGKRVVFFDLEDETGLLNVTSFDETYQRDGHSIVCSPYVTVVGESQDRDGHIAFLASRVFPFRPGLLAERPAENPVGAGDFLMG